MIGVPLVVKIIFDITTVLSVPTVLYEYKNVLKNQMICFTQLPLSTGGKMCHAQCRPPIKHVPGLQFTIWDVSILLVVQI